MVYTMTCSSVFPPFFLYNCILGFGAKKHTTLLLYKANGLSLPFFFL